MYIKRLFLIFVLFLSSISLFAVDSNFLNDFEKKLVKINGTDFVMGSADFEKNEAPAHKVNVSSFLIHNTEITQAEYKAIVNHNFSYNKGDALPVEEVSWYDAVVFCNLLSAASNLEPCYSLNGSVNVEEWGEVPRITASEEEKNKWNSIVCNFEATGYRLPTEAEWELSAASYTNANDAMWFALNSEKVTHQVATKAANANGLFDMNGNVWEWCQDWYGWYKTADGVNDVDKTGRKIRRGGSVLSDEEFCRSQNRASSEPSLRGIDLGFRVVRKVVEETVPAAPATVTAPSPASVETETSVSAAPASVDVSPIENEVLSEEVFSDSYDAK